MGYIFTLIDVRLYVLDLIVMKRSREEDIDGGASPENCGHFNGLSGCYGRENVVALGINENYRPVTAAVSCAYTQ